MRSLGLSDFMYLVIPNWRYTAAVKSGFTTRQGIIMLAVIVGALMLTLLLAIWTAPPNPFP